VLDREVIREFLDEELKEKEMEIPKDIFKEALVETFCKYVEDDYYEWLKDNFKSFFNYGKPDWQLIRERIEECKR
jgi:nuclear transport factor 2 (NTF2) superfamily protein